MLENKKPARNLGKNGKSMAFNTAFAKLVTSREKNVHFNHGF